MTEAPYEIDPVKAMAMRFPVKMVNRRHDVFVDSGATYRITSIEQAGNGYEMTCQCLEGPADIEGEEQRFNSLEFRVFAGVDALAEV